MFFSTKVIAADEARYLDAPLCDKNGEPSLPFLDLILKIYGRALELWQKARAEKTAVEDEKRSEDGVLLFWDRSPAERKGLILQELKKFLAEQSAFYCKVTLRDMLTKKPSDNILFQDIEDFLCQRKKHSLAGASLLEAALEIFRGEQQRDAELLHQLEARIKEKERQKRANAAQKLDLQTRRIITAEDVQNAKAIKYLFKMALRLSQPQVFRKLLDEFQQKIGRGMNAADQHILNNIQIELAKVRLNIELVDLAKEFGRYGEPVALIHCFLMLFMAHERREFALFEMALLNHKEHPEIQKFALSLLQGMAKQDVKAKSKVKDLLVHVFFEVVNAYQANNKEYDINVLKELMQVGINIDHSMFDFDQIKGKTNIAIKLYSEDLGIVLILLLISLGYPTEEALRAQINNWSIADNIKAYYLQKAKKVLAATKR